MDYLVIAIIHQKMFLKSKVMILQQIGSQMLLQIVTAMLIPNLLLTIFSAISKTLQIQIFLAHQVLQILEHHKTPLGV
jgi:hypothetical protein